jgi:DNA-binding CsgD family transcriptional regulator
MPSCPPDIAAIAAVVGRIGTPALPQSLDDMLASTAPFDLSAIFGFPFDQRPLLLHDGYGNKASPEALEAYLAGAYLFDPFYTACTRNVAAGLWRMREVAPDAFFGSDFYSSREVHPCISLQAGSLVEEIAFLVPLPTGITACYSLMRARGMPFSHDEMEALKTIEPIVRETIRAHFRDALAVPDPGRLEDLMETAFAAFCEDVLTYRQRRIVQLILRGNSNHAIGAILNVTEGTVKMHRQNIYKRLNISSQRELFAMFVKTLLRPARAEIHAPTN